MFLNRNFNAEPINTQADRRKEDTIFVDVQTCKQRVCVLFIPVSLVLDAFGNIPASYQGLGNGVRSRYWCDFSAISHVT